MDDLTPQEERLSKYLSDVGSFSYPSDDLISELHSIELSPRLFINIQQLYVSIDEFNGVLAYLLASLYKQEGYTPYEVWNIWELHTSASESENFSQFFEFDVDLFVLVGGIDLLEYEGQSLDDDTPWTIDAYTDSAEQAIGWRLKKGLPIWYVSVDNPYPRLETTFDNEDFDRYDVKTGGSNGKIVEDGV